VYVTLNTINDVFGGGLVVNAIVDFEDEAIVLLAMRVRGDIFYVHLLFSLQLVQQQGVGNGSCHSMWPRWSFYVVEGGLHVWVL
jgi:hypothetical protein